MNTKTNMVIAVGLMAWFTALAPALGATGPGSWPAREALVTAEKSVQQAMQGDIQALKAREITRSEVADRALSYAEKAESDAEKILLYKGAFNEYVKAGAFDKALAAVNALCGQYPDMPAQYKTTLLANALRAVPRKNGGSLYRLLDETKALAAAEARLKTLEPMRARKTDDRAFQLELGELLAVKGDWQQALPAFARSSDDKAAAYARSERDGAVTLDAANFWWEYRGRDKASPLPARNFRGHALDIYGRAMCMGEVKGLSAITVDRRIAEYESEYGCRLGDSGAKAADTAQEKPGTPHVARIFPANGAQDVDPSIKFVRIVFDRPMRPLVAFCTDGTPEGEKAYPGRQDKDDGSDPVWSDDRKELLFPVKLLPGRSYLVFLNSAKFMQFGSAEDVPLKPYTYSFRTRGTGAGAK